MRPAFDRLPGVEVPTTDETIEMFAQTFLRAGGLRESSQTQDE
ncbi:hypothetical protein [Streptomyces sp. NPDC002580]